MPQSIRWLQDEIADRMLQKLDIVKLNVRDILVIPDFSGVHHSAFAKRFPGATIHSIAEAGTSHFQIWRNKVFANWRALFQAGIASSITTYTSTEKISLSDNSVDLVFCNLLLQDLAEPKRFLQECRRVLREGGLFVFSYLGPDTGKELRSLQTVPFQLKNLLSPWDMHDMGDALMAERFSDPVMDMEHLTLDYEKPGLLLGDLEALKLASKPTDGDVEVVTLPQKLTLEVVYGHAWVVGKHLSKTQDSVAYIDLNQIGRKTR